MFERSKLISDGYQKLQAQFHKERPDYGVSGHIYAENIAHLAEILGVTEILDYGCGKETLAESLPQYNIVGYDPGIEHKADEPEPHDLVVCSDVMEHIEPDLVDNVIQHIASLTNKVAFFQVSTVPAGKTMPDGRNAHICVQPPEWWLSRLVDVFRLDKFERLGSGFIAVVSKRHDH